MFSPGEGNNTNALRRCEQAEWELELRNQVNSQLFDWDNPNGAIEKSLRVLIERFNLDFALIHLIKSNRLELWKRVSYIDSPGAPLKQSLPLPEYDFREVARVLKTSPETLERILIRELNLEGGRWIFIPLGGREDCLGSILIGSREKRVMPRFDRGLIDALSAQLGCYINNSMTMENMMSYTRELDRKIKERTLELEVLYEISRVIIHSPDYAQLLEMILNTLNNLLQFDLAGYIICVDDKYKFVVQLNIPVPEKILKSYTKEIRERFVQISPDSFSSCPQRATRVIRGIDFEDDEPLYDEAIKSSFYVPLKMEEKVVGILNISSFEQNCFSNEHIRMLNTIALQASMSLTQLRNFLDTRKTTFESILENINTGVILIDGAYQVKMVNPEGEKALKKLTGMETGDQLKTLGAIPIEDLVDDILWKKVEIKNEEIILSGVNPQYFRLTISPFRMGDTGVVGAIITIQDITEEKIANQQLMQIGRMASVGELAAGVAHEINNPLTGILGFSELLLRQSNLGREVREVIEDIYSSGKRAAQITEDLLYFAHDQKEKTKEVINLVDVLDKTLKLVERQYHKFNISFIHKYSEEKLPMYGISGKIQQVLLNLFGNSKDAIMAAHKGSTISVDARKIEDNWIQLIIEDNGPGIDKDIQDRIFDPFFTTKEVGKGTGLGLSITYRIIQDHGGKIFVKSEKGKYTRFIISFPPPGEEKDKEQEQETPDQKSLADKLQILAVDDEEMILKFVRKYYTTLGYDVTTANNPQKGIKMIGEGNYDLILIDFRMPGMTGEELFRQVMKIRPDVKDKIVMVTGDVMGEEVKSFLEETNIRFLLKPIDLKDLRTLVEQVE